MKIGYLPYTLDFSAPGDRRRLKWFIDEKNLDFEIADINKKYKIIYVVYGNNLSELLSYKKKNPDTNIIFEYIDAYLEEKNIFRIYSRGIFRFLLGREKKLYLNYNNLIKKFIRQSDIVVCSNDFQRRRLLRFNKNIKVSIDYIEIDFQRRQKKIISKVNKLNIFWEGQIYTLKHLRILNHLSKKLKDKIHVHILTDLEKWLIPNFYSLKAQNISKSFKFNFTIYQWTKEEVNKISNICDLGIIPLFENDKLAYHKPENKLILMWLLGLPVITSETPSYKKAMQSLNNKRLCKNTKDWENYLNKFINASQNEIRNDLIDIEKKLKKDYSKEKYILDWLSIFDSLSIENFS